LALAALETLVHLEMEEAPSTLVAVPADIPEDVPITRVKPGELAPNWRTIPSPEDLAELGTRWLRARNTLVLAVPSAIIPRELNYLLNPLHPHFKRVRIGRPEPFFFDPRLWKRRSRLEDEKSL
jgi:RES domain-containing protein